MNFFDCHGGPGTTEPACGACVTCLHRVIESKDAEITRLKAAGEELWKKAHALSVRETYDQHGNEIDIEDLPHDTVVFEYDHGDGLEAKVIVALNSALDGWKKAVEAAP